MKIKFWGVRGSIPSPAAPQQIQTKIKAAVQRITFKDIESQDARERFIASLPYWIFGTAGGNTPCVELKGYDGTEVILDAGSGLRCMGRFAKPPKTKHYNLFFSHFHWDHIQGLPFFEPVYDPDTVFDVYSGRQDGEELLRRQQDQPYFPVQFDSFTKNFSFHYVQPGTEFITGCFKVNMCRMTHPGGSYSYSFEENNKKFVYATDVELSKADSIPTPERNAVFKNADCIILDSQYTVQEANEKKNWGHSDFCDAVDFAANWGIKTVFLFHHDPAYDDKKLNELLIAARQYAEHSVHGKLKIFIAIENQEFEI